MYGTVGVPWRGGAPGAAPRPVSQRTPTEASALV